MKYTLRSLQRSQQWIMVRYNGEVIENQNELHKNPMLVYVEIACSILDWINEKRNTITDTTNEYMTKG